MPSVSKQEFSQWISTLSLDELNETDVKILNIITKNFSELEGLSTVAGRRAKRISELISENFTSETNKLVCIVNNSHKISEHVKNIVEIEIGPFRGFTNKEIFNFYRKYTFLYGPNGSGKSSFCEGLEYALLGSIEEAAAKRINSDKYIQNAVKLSAAQPIAYTINEKGQKEKIEPNQQIYRFSFLEKNRIDDFARISAFSNGVQKDRIATLFGLDEFSEFVDGFTDNFNNYLLLSNEKAKEFEHESNKYEEHLKKMVEIDLLIEKDVKSINELIEVVKNQKISTRDELMNYLVGEDKSSGIINSLQKQKLEQIPKDIDTTDIGVFKVLYASLVDITSELVIKVNKLITLSADINYKDLYSSIIAISKSEEHDESICPACKTPISSVVVNPFENAIIELDNLKEISSLQIDIESSVTTMQSKIMKINEYILKITSSAKIVGFENFSLSKLNEPLNLSISKIEAYIPTLKSELDSLISEFSGIDEVQKLIVIFNEKLLNKRQAQNLVDSEIKKYQNIHTELIRFDTNLHRSREDRESTKSFIEGFKKDNSLKLSEIKNIDLIIDRNKEILSSYTKLVNSLKSYRNDLPSKLASGLAEKVVTYYNIINAHDPDFEKLSSVLLPISPGSPILVSFNGDKKQYDALHILSEGHIKVLGLSILLSKAITDNLRFLIFDDIVNAIDDDHRDGISNLLMCHEDFLSIQHIVTCHGEQFINKLEHKLGASRTSKEVQSYRFRPVDSISKRGVMVSIGNSKHYLVQAENELALDERKNSVSHCRQAVESTSETLWKKMSQKSNISLSVCMRGPSMRPDLSSVVDGLIKELKRLNDKSELYLAFKELKEKYQWSILNKGTHEQDDLPEFERIDVNNLLDLLKRIEVLVDDFSLTISIT